MASEDSSKEEKRSAWKARSLSRMLLADPSSNPRLMLGVEDVLSLSGPRLPHQL